MWTEFYSKYYRGKNTEEKINFTGTEKTAFSAFTYVENKSY